MPGETPNNRITTKQFYEALLDQNKQRSEMERRIMKELKGVPTQVATNKGEIDRLRLNSNVKDVAIAVGAAIGTAVAAVIGSKQ